MDDNDEEHEDGDHHKEEDGETTNKTSAIGSAGPNATSSSLYGSQGHTGKRVCCYVGNLTWWTTDKDLTDAIVGTLNVTDLIDIKFYENKTNGQSKGFALVTVGSDQTFRTLMDKLPKQQINGQDPIVTHFNRHYFNQFEEQARKDMPNNGGGNSGDFHSGPGGSMAGSNSTTSLSNSINNHHHHNHPSANAHQHHHPNSMPSSHGPGHHYSSHHIGTGPQSQNSSQHSSQGSLGQHPSVNSSSMHLNNHSQQPHFMSMLKNLSSIIINYFFPI